MRPDTIRPARDGNLIPFHTFLLKIASRCNINCTYCYVYHLADSTWRKQPTLMSAETVRQIAFRMLDHLLSNGKKSASIIFHGGEPLLGGRRHIELLLDVIAEVFCGAAIDLSMGLQTNLLLFDAEIGEILRARNVSVGVSVDGPPEVNDRRRVDHLGRGSSALLAEKLALLTSPRFRPIFSGFLSVIDPTSDPANIIDYLSSFDPPSIDFLLPLDNHDRLPLGMKKPCGPSPHGVWLIKAFEYWLSLEKPLSVRMFDNIIALLCGASSRVESLGLTPVDLIVVETNGDIEAVDSLKATYSGATRLGFDVYSHTFDMVAAHPAVLARQVGLSSLCDSCRSCDVVEICGGGYLPHRFSSARGFANRSVYCDALYLLIHHVRNTLLRELATTVRGPRSERDGRSRQNGFASVAAMNRAHEPIVRLARSVLAAEEGALVVDLGCGNGLLLREIVSGSSAIPFGIEVDSRKARRAAVVLRNWGGTVVSDDMYTSDYIWNKSEFDLAIVAARAFLEGPPKLVEQLRNKLAHHSRRLLVYAYSDDERRFGSLDGMARRAGLKLLGPRQSSTARLAEILTE